MKPPPVVTDAAYWMKRAQEAGIDLERLKNYILEQRQIAEHAIGDLITKEPSGDYWKARAQKAEAELDRMRRRAEEAEARLPR